MYAAQARASGGSAITRPRFHHTPPAGWVNDPLGLTYHDGRYHLFFQLVPDRTTWDVACRWGHATSADLLTWTPEPIALEPGDGEDGIWSGSLADAADGAAIFYTGVGATRREIGWVRRAAPDDPSWRTWSKEAIVVTLPDGETAVAFRDPHVYRDAAGDGWRMLLGGGVEGGIPVVWMATSSDLRNWRLAGRAAEGGDPTTGAVWECPALLRVDGRAVLIVADGHLHTPSHATYAWVEEAGDRLIPGPWWRLSYGPSYYAASGFHDAGGRPGLIHWLRGVADEADGWAGAHSLPHLVRREGDRLVAEPHPAIETRRGAPVADGVLPAAADLVWRPRAGESLRLEAATGTVRAIVTADELHVDAGGQTASMPWTPGDGPVRLIVDGPTLEVFATEGVLALPIPAAASWQVTASGDLEAWPLA